MTSFVEIELTYNDLANNGKDNGYFSYYAIVDDETIRDFIVETRVGKETYKQWQPLSQHFFWLAIQYVFNFEDMICVQALEQNDNFMKWLYEHEREKAQSCFDKEQGE